MRGRGDGRFQSRGGGWGRYGRGQGELHKPIVKGRKPEVGAYLDLPRGQAADPEAVLKWLECLRVYMYSTYESSVKEIIGIDGVLTDYEEFVEPDDPPDNAGMVAIERWKTASKKYAANIELHFCMRKIVWCNIRSDVGGLNHEGERDAGRQASHRGL